MVTEKYLNAEEASKYLNISKSNLNNMRSQRTGPRFCKLGPKTVRYLIEDLDDWAQANVIDPS